MLLKDPLNEVRSILSDTINHHGEGVIVTADPEGHPHASWMGTLGSEDISTILTMASPEGAKITNILQNPKVEWMFSDKDLETVIYLKGEARIIHEEGEVQEAWKKLKDKSRAYFLQYAPPRGMSFMIIETKVDEINFSRPRENVSETFYPPF